jgi:hypothetical protein
LAYDTGPSSKATKKEVIAKCAKKKSKATGKPASTRLRAEVGDLHQAHADGSQENKSRHTLTLSNALTSSLTKRQKALQSAGTEFLQQETQRFNMV